MAKLVPKELKSTVQISEEQPLTAAEIDLVIVSEGKFKRHFGGNREIVGLSKVAEIPKAPNVTNAGKICAEIATQTRLESKEWSTQTDVDEMLKISTTKA